MQSKSSRIKCSKPKILLLLLFLTTCSLFGRVAPKSWVIRSPFEQKDFVENVGQFNLDKNFPNHKILYSIRTQGVYYFLTDKGIIFSKYLVTHSENETSKESEEEGFELENKFTFLEWSNINSSLNIVKQRQVENYYTYYTSEMGSIKASAYKEIIYQDIYKNIDLKFETLSDSGGLKYSFILHQGANAADIKMKFSKSSAISLLPSGNLEIKSEIGSLIDYHPIAFLKNESSTILKCSYTSNNNNVTFNLGDYPKDKEVIIDPWIIDPTYTSLDKAFDVDYDTSGNVFVYGDNPPYLIKKYDKNGNLLWTYTLSLLGFQFGDFTVVKSANLIYVALGHANYGAGIVKLNESGVQQAQIVSNQFSEIWRINYSSCINKIIVGSPCQYRYSNLQLVDTSLTTISQGNQVTTAYNSSDIHCLALDSFGNGYVIDDNGANKNGIYYSQLIKLPLPNLYPISYCVPSEYNWRELYTNNYYYYPSYTVGHFPNGYNGLCCSNYYLYSSDNYVLKKWDSNTGKVLKNFRLNTPIGNDSTHTYWGGIDADDCDHIVVGDIKKLKIFNSDFTILDSLLLPDTVYDVRLDNKGKIYACGLGFLTSIQMDTTLCVPKPKNNTVSNALVNNALESPNANIFTPNGDPYNEEYFPFVYDTITVLNQLELLSESYNLKIYNRWGDLLFETNDITNGWNGKNKEGNSVPSGVYFWIASFGSTRSSAKCGTPNGTSSKLTKGFLQLER